MATVQDAIIYKAFEDLGVTAPGETISSGIRDAAFTTLLQLMESMSAEQVMNYVVYHQIFPSGAGGVVAGTAVYTLGTGGTMVATARPIRITSAVSALGNQRIPVQVMSWDQFNREVQDELSSRSVFARKMAADQAFPAINIRLWPMPDTSPATLELDYHAPLPVFAAVSDTITLPEAWTIMLRSNLAVFGLGPQYARPTGIPKELIELAQRSKAAIADKNAAILGLGAAPQAA